MIREKVRHLAASITCCVFTVADQIFVAKIGQTHDNVRTNKIFLENYMAGNTSFFLGKDWKYFLLTACHTVGLYPIIYELSLLLIDLLPHPC